MASEPISPELVLVCPQLREHALAQLPDAPWAAVASQVRLKAAAAAAAAAATPSKRESVVERPLALARLAISYGIVALAVPTVVTLVLTLVADAIR